jgi:hypothetical protein
VITEPAAMCLKSGLSLALILFVYSAGADVHVEDNRIWRRAKVIAPGQQVLSLQTSYQQISDRYSEDGHVEPLGNQYSRSLAWNQLQKGDKAGSADIQSYMNQSSVRASDIAATSSYQVTRQELGFDANWAYGLTRSWMIGMQLPLTLTRTQVDQQVQMTPTLANGAGQPSGHSILALSKRDLSGRVKQIAENQLSASGYDRIPTRRQSWDFGEISLLSQILLYESYNWAWALQQRVGVPTGQGADSANYIQNSPDESAVNLGLSSMLDFQRRHWVYGFRLGYVAQMPDTVRMHMPSESDSTGAAIDPKVNRRLGDWAWAAIDTEYHVARQWDLNAEYSYLAKSKDHYSGGTFSADDYAQLSQNTDEQLHQTRVGVVYRIGSLSTRNGIASRWLAELDYTYPWIGRNASDAAMTSLELSNYF